MTTQTSVTRRRFLKMSSAVPIGAAVLPAMSEVAFGAVGAVSAAGVPEVGSVNSPTNVAILNGNEYPVGPTQAAVEAMHRVSVSGNRYFNTDTSDFSAQVAAYHDLKPNYVTLYAGSAEPLRFATMAFTSATRPLVTPDPIYESAWGAAAAIGAKVHRVPLKADYTQDMKAMAAADPNTGMFYVCNPNNPTGVVETRASIEWLLANKPAGAIVLVDEAYIHFSDAESVIDLVAKDKDLIVLRSFSKIYSMAGLRFGYAMARPDIMAKLRSYGVNHVPTTAVQCAKAQLEDKQLVPLRKKANADAREKAFEWLAKNGYSFTPSQSSCFLLDVKRPGAAVANALAHRNVVIGRTWAIAPNMPRITVGSPQEMQSFQTAFLEVMQMPTDAMSGLVHPHERLMAAHVC